MKETMVEAKVTYTLEYCGKFYIVEHVPARTRVSGDRRAILRPRNGRADPEPHQRQQETCSDNRDSCLRLRLKTPNKRFQLTADKPRQRNRVVRFQLEATTGDIDLASGEWTRQAFLAWVTTHVQRGVRLSPAGSSPCRRAIISGDMARDKTATRSGRISVGDRLEHAAGIT